MRLPIKATFSFDFSLNLKYNNSKERTDYIKSEYERLHGKYYIVLLVKKDNDYHFNFTYSSGTKAEVEIAGYKIYLFKPPSTVYEESQ